MQRKWSRSLLWILAISFDLTHPLSINMNNAEKMCEVTSFCCGCADLRKGALIIGSLNLVNKIIITIINNIVIINNYNKVIIGSLNLVNTMSPSSSLLSTTNNMMTNDHHHS